jgi:DNA-binding MarR family transcriptional regulator
MTSDMPKQKPVTLAEEIKQSRPFSCVEEEAYLSLVRTSAELVHSTDQFLKPFGITPSQYNVLRILRGAGAEGLGRNQIAERMVTPTPDASRLLDRLEESGWVRRKRGKEDRRQVNSCITATGLKLLKKIDTPVAALHKNQFPGVSKTDLHHLTRILSQLRNSRA